LNTRGFNQTTSEAGEFKTATGKEGVMLGGMPSESQFKITSNASKLSLGQNRSTFTKGSNAHKDESTAEEQPHDIDVTKEEKNKFYEKGSLL